MVYNTQVTTKIKRKDDVHFKHLCRIINQEEATLYLGDIKIDLILSEPTRRQYN